MTKNGALLLSYAFSILLLNMSFLICRANDEERKVYIVYMGSLPENDAYSPMSHHLLILQRVVPTGLAAKLLKRSYKRSFNGFAAELTSHEKASLANMKEVVSVFPSTNFQLHTTRSWDFIGLNAKSRRNGTAESDIIVGVIDCGIWPESDSFKGVGSSPPPKKWKGACEGGKNFTCNNKLIGARFYEPAESARDEIGHGSHTASTAAGNVVNDVSFYGIGQGVATGGAPSARVAAYKVCSAQGCPVESIMAAFDDAIADGVDIITCSLGTTEALPFEEDPIAIGGLHAAQKGILTTQSAGNDGPTPGSITSVAPWLFSVAASTIDRRLVDKVVLGDGKTMVGASVNSFTLNGTSFPLIYGKAAASSNCSEFTAGHCHPDCLDSNLIKGKIVLCDIVSGGDVAFAAGAVGSILRDDDYGTEFAHVVGEPATILSLADHNALKAYIKSTKDAQGNILKSEAIKDVAAPVVASFSSRGPNSIVPEIMKPDIIAPGVTILAAFSPLARLSQCPGDDRRVNYNVLTGTSMSCPHAAGAAAYVRSFHPDWSPAAVKSSLMTTAWRMNATNSTPGEFDYGSGHINPAQAIDPGLVYEASKEDYRRFLCLVLGATQVRLILGDDSTCSPLSTNNSTKDYNYPSLAAAVPLNKPFTVNFHRVVKNVGLPKSTYKANILTNSTKADIKVVPQVLSFESLNEEKPYDVTVVGQGLSSDEPYVSASLVWSDGTHIVKSPVLIYQAIDQ